MLIKRRRRRMVKVNWRKSLPLPFRRTCFYVRRVRPTGRPADGGPPSVDGHHTISRARALSLCISPIRAARARAPHQPKHHTNRQNMGFLWRCARPLAISLHKRRRRVVWLNGNYFRAHTHTHTTNTDNSVWKNICVRIIFLRVYHKDRKDARGRIFWECLIGALPLPKKTVAERE